MGHFFGPANTTDDNINPTSLFEWPWKPRSSHAAKYLKRWDITPQRSLKLVLGQDPTKVGVWLKQSYPAVLKRAKAEGAVILRGDETAVKEDRHALGEGICGGR